MHETDYPKGLGLVRPGRTVYYQNDGRGGFDYFVPAIISVTRVNLVRAAVEQGLLEDLDSPLHVHLLVFGPGGVYYERNVPYDKKGAKRTWRLMEV
ncbi:MAG: hypothetical protein LC650_00810 [Actinobacteria bacterium]|nr:hypothetical protein [Actinomycetota bacterium]